MDDTIQIPGYIIERNLGAGAMATVYLAMQQALERRVALKLMAASLVADSDFRERFRKEGKFLAQLNHPNIVTIYDIGEFQNSFYMAMEYVEGTTLKEYLQEPLHADDAVDILCQVASALGYAHERNFVHRDVKPANILMRKDGAAILSDFGIAKVLGGDGTQMTQQGFTIGTPKYMSPEQALGKEIDARSDIYALGAVFHEMLTGAAPYQASDSFALALMHVNDPVPTLPEAYAPYQQIIDRAMAKEPDDRYATAEEMVQDVRRVHKQAGGSSKSAPDTLVGPNIVAKPRSKKDKAGDEKPRSNAVAWVGALAGVAALIVVVVLLVGPGVGKIISETDPCANPPILAQENRARVEQLLEIAIVNHEVGRLVDPPVSNAAHGYQEILKIDTCNAKARQGLKAIATTYESQARDCLTQGKDLNICLNAVKAGLIADPNYSSLLKLEQEINQQLAQG